MLALCVQVACEAGGGWQYKRPDPEVALDAVGSIWVLAGETQAFGTHHFVRLNTGGWIQMSL